VADWRPEVIAAVEQWAHTQPGAEEGATWRRRGQATPHADDWLVLDLRDQGPGPESWLRACLGTAEGPERDPAFPVEELRVVDSVVHLREPVGLPPASRYVWTQEMSPRFLAERLAHGLRAASSAPLADALAGRELAGPPTAQVDAPALLDAQVEALRACLSPGVRLVCGPPGTGRTEVLARALEEQVRRGHRVLLVSAADVAVDQVLLTAVRRLRPEPGTVLRVGWAQLSEIASDPGVQLDLLAARAAADAARERARAGADLAELAQNDEAVDRLREQLADYDDPAFRRAATRVDGEVAARTARSSVRDAEAAAESAEDERSRASAERDEAEQAYTARTVERAAYADLDRLSAELEELDREQAAAELARDAPAAVTSPVGWFAARRRRARRAARDAASVVADAESRRPKLLALQQEARQLVGSFSRAELTEIDERWQAARARATDADAEYARTRDRLASAQEDLAIIEGLGTPSAADRELVAACRAAGTPTRFAEFLRLLAAQRASSDRRAALQAEYGELIDRCRTLRADAERELVSEARVVATTLAGSRVHPAVSEEMFDVVLVDEAAAATLAEVLLALARGRVTAVLFGDLPRLGPVLDSDVDRHEDPGHRRWIAATCFSHVGVATPEQAVEHSSCTVLPSE
jgi:hypothetical protein